LERFKEGSGKIVNKAKDILKSANLDLDKVTVARKVLDLLSKEKLDEKTKEIFSELFNKINSQIQIFKVRMDVKLCSVLAVEFFYHVQAG
jgi:hypothetical protein